MKTLVLSMISIAATVAAMTACTSESDPIDEIVNPKDAKVEVKLNAGISSVSSKAAINSNTEGKPTTDISNVFFYKQEVDGTTNPNWTTAVLNSPINASIKQSGEIDFGGNTQYYPVNGYHVHFIGYYTGQSTAATVGANNSIPITITGAEDVLYGSTFDAGTRSTITDNRSITFAHKLTQIKFTLQKDAKVTNEVSITSMKIIKASGNDLKNTFNMSLADGELSNWAGSISNGVTLTGLPINALEESASSPTAGVMLEPEITSVTVEVSSTSFPEGKLTATIEGVSSGKFSAGTAYTIALTVKGQSVSGNASIEQWTEETGSGNL